jgi:tetratricopeptide (TPR) repeat protein
MNEWLAKKPGWNRAQLILPAVMICLTAWFAFSPAMHGDWLWDDNTEITCNLDLRGPDALNKIWFTPSSPDYFPVKSTMQWIQWQLWHDQSTTGYHLTNLGLHILGSLLLWRVLRKLGVRHAWIGGLLFAVHPVAVESVAWIAEFKNVLSLPALLLALSAYLDYDECKRPADYVVSIIWFIIALLCKSSVVMFPFFLLLYIGWKRGKFTRSDLRATGLFFGVSLVSGLVTIWFQHHRAIDSWEVSSGGFFDRMAAARHALFFYGFKCLWPVGLSPVYPFWPEGGSTLWLLFSIVAAGAFVTYIWIRKTTHGRHASLALGWFIIHLLPVLGFIEMSYLAISPVADHLMYLSLAGWAAFIALSVDFIDCRMPINWRKAPAIIAVLICGVLAWQSRGYAAVFTSPEAMWTETLNRNSNVWIAHNNLGVILQQKGEWSDAAPHFEMTVRLRPRYASAHVNLGSTYAHLDRWEEAMRCYQTALELEPDSFEAHFNLANALAGQGRLREAIDHYQSALRLSPEAADAHYNLANVLVEARRLPEALVQYSETLRYKPDSFEAHVNMGNLLAETGQWPEAIVHFETAVLLAPRSIEAIFALADALAQSGRLAESADRYIEAVHLAPDNAVLHTQLAHVFARLGRQKDAIEHYTEALRFEPENREARDALSAYDRR